MLELVLAMAAVVLLQITILQAAAQVQQVLLLLNGKRKIL
jgi:hypothetical protein